MARSKAWLLLVLTNLFWAGNYVFGKYVIAEMTPVWITFTRWVLAVLFLIPIAHLTEKPDWRLARSKWLPLAAMGVLGAVGFNLLLYSALAFTTATNAALVSALNPAVIVLFSVFMLREKIGGLQIAGFIMSLVGVAVIITRGDLFALFAIDYNRGDLLMIAAVLVWTFYSILGKRLASVPPITATAISALYGAIVLAPFAFLQGIDLDKIGPLAITGILYITLFPSIGSFVFWNMSVRAIGASQAGVFLNLIPVFTAIISWFLGERMTSSEIWGGLLVLLGVYLTTGALNRWLEQRKQNRLAV